MGERQIEVFTNPYKTAFIDELNGEIVEVTRNERTITGKVVSNLVNVLVIDVAGDRCVVRKKDMCVVESLGGL